MVKPKDVVTLSVVAIIVAVLAYPAWIHHRLNRKRKMSPVARCKSALRQIDLAIRMHQNDHNMVQPDSLTPLLEYVGDPLVFLAPGSAKQPGDLNDVDSWSDYRYVRPANREGDPSVVAYMPPWNNKWQVGFVLLSNGQVLRFLPKAKDSETFEAFMLEHGF